MDSNSTHSGVPPAGGSTVELMNKIMYTISAIYNSEAKKVYIGQTVNLEARLEQHNHKVFKGYASRFDGLWDLIYSEEAGSRVEALTREKQLKSFRGREFIKQHIPA